MTILTIDSAVHQKNSKIFISSPELGHVSNIFSSTARGRLFTIIRHPVELAIMRYHHLVSQNVIPYITIEQFVSSSHFQDNIVTRSLISGTNDIESLTEDHFIFAKSVLRRKCLIGLQDQLDGFVYRVERYFELANSDSNSDEVCVKGLIEKHRKEDDDIIKKYPGEGSAEWKMIERKNEFDLMIFTYAQELFEDESKIRYKAQRQQT